MLGLLLNMEVSDDIRRGWWISRIRLPLPEPLAYGYREYMAGITAMGLNATSDILDVTM
jgi:hypothetical protein